MCLDFAKTEDIPQYKEGYKVFTRFRKNNKWNLAGCHKTGTTFAKRRWSTDSSNETIVSYTGAGRYGSYKTGFHCFVSKEDAIQYAELDEAVHRVLTKEITATGKQGQYPAFAARQIFIMEEILRDKKKGSYS